MNNNETEINVCVQQRFSCLLVYYPIMLSHFRPAPVKTDRAVRIQ